MTGNTIYLNTAACGLVSKAATKAGTDLYENFATNSSAASEYWRDTTSFQIRKTIADFVSAKEENMAFIPNFSYAMNSVVHSLRGDEKILLYKNDYPSLTIPFAINHFDITWIEDENGFLIDIDKIASLIEEKQIDIVAISHVQWQSGFKIDLARLSAMCKEKNVWLIVDATQSLGGVEINLSTLPLDVFIASNYKWMNAGFGTGILYINNEFLEKYPPKISGNNSKTVQFENDQYTFNPGISNFEPGHLNQFGFSVLAKAIEEKNAIGLQKIEAHNKNLTQQLLDKLLGLPIHLIGDASIENRSSIVVLKEENGLHEFLLQRSIITTLRNAAIRISLHFHN
ncbi:MAG TPA: aminotransferase class V-fold PLP-dependent enzyme, partial [Arachidicoccus sp.]